MAELNAASVKKRGRELGADLVGIASAATLNAFPPDPRWPQTPERISPYCKSVIVLVQRIPAGAFRCKGNVPVQYIDMLVWRLFRNGFLKIGEVGVVVVADGADRKTARTIPDPRHPLATASPSFVPLADQRPFLLSQRGKQVQHKWVNVRAKLRHDKRHLVRHQPRDEMHLRAALIEAASFGRRSSASAPLPLSCSSKVSAIR